MTPCSLCSLPVTATKRAPSTIARSRSKTFGHTMILATPVSSSSVMKMTPCAVPGRWRTSTRPATVTRAPFLTELSASERKIPRAVRRARMNEAG